MKKMLLIPFCLFLVTGFGQTKLIIQTTGEKCATVETDARNTPVGDQGVWAADLSRGDGTFLTIRSYLQFDLSSIPAGSFVNWARLTLFGLGSFIGGDNTTLLRRVTSAWDPATLTWNTQPAITKRGTVRLPKSFSGQVNYENIDVWKLVQPMVDSPAKNFGFEIKLDTERDSAFGTVLFFSPAFGRPHSNPKLVIEYTAPGMQQKVTALSVDLSGASTEMTIYPNPCNKAFNCNIKSAETESMTLSVVDMLGRTVYSQPVNTSNLQMRVNLPSSSSGTYFVILQGNKNTTLISQQLQVN